MSTLNPVEWRAMRAIAFGMMVIAGAAFLLAVYNMLHNAIPV